MERTVKEVNRLREMSPLWDMVQVDSSYFCLNQVHTFIILPPSGRDRSEDNPMDPTLIPRILHLGSLFRNHG